ncbi:MAG TPA: DUF1186 domain-containing protein, partial [Hyphomicrobiales bacterium]
SIIDQLDCPKGLPRQALAIASERREELAPLLIAEIQDFLLADPDERVPSNALFFIFHLLGSWGETAAYRPLAALLRLSNGDLEWLMGDATTETSHRVMAAVFDGDPQPLYDIILDKAADEFVRGNMFETLAILVHQQKLHRDVVADFLRRSFDDLQDEGGNFVWHGWQSAIAMLGLDELTPLVKIAFERELVARYICEFRHFEKDLAFAKAAPTLPEWHGSSCLPFGDVVEELSTWKFASDDKDLSPDWSPTPDWGDPPAEPASNPHRNVGRNDPCPCGSGKKFKKCCLN